MSDASNPAAQDRPLVTFALFAYNQEQYIREAVEGAFSQTYSPLEIILSDDCSTDRTFEIMQEMAAAYQGPHEVRVRQGAKNLGVARHFDDLIRLAHGEYFVAAAGDDVSDPDRTLASVCLAKKYKDLGFVEVKCMNFLGDPECGLPRIERRHVASPKHQVFSIQDVLSGTVTGYVGAGRAYRRTDYVRFPPLLEGCPAEDTPALFRCLYGGSGAIIDEYFVSRRIHDHNLSGIDALSKMDMLLMESQYRQDANRALEINLISKMEHQRLIVELDKYAFRKRCAIDVHNGFRNQIKFGHVLRSRHFSIREKLFFLKKGLLARAKG